MRDESEGSHRKWARFRFSVVGGLLASPAPRGELRAELKALAADTASANEDTEGETSSSSEAR